MHAIKKILVEQKSITQWLMYVALLLGFLLLFLSIQLMVDVNDFLQTKEVKKSKNEFLVVNKIITNKMMGDNQSSYFTANEIEDLKKVKSVEKLDFIASNQYPISASTTGELGFYTQLFFESVPENCLDIEPKNFSWVEGQQTLPIILSADFLNLYNFGFALSQGLPQMSEETIQALSFEITIGQNEKYKAEVAGFTQRYSSVLVPYSFMNYANKKYGNVTTQKVSRIILNTNEPDNPELVKYLNEKKYSTQNDKLKWSKIKSVVTIVFSVSSFLGLFILALAIMVLFLYLKMTIIQHKEQLKLLFLLGYKPSVLHKYFTHKTFILFIILLVITLVSIAIFQYIIAQYLLKYQVKFSLFISWKLLLMALCIMGLLFFILKKNVQKIIHQVI